MISHSFIVCALFAFSLVAQAGEISLDANPADASVTLNAVLHKDMELQQGGNDGKDVMEAQGDDACKSGNACAVDVVSNPQMQNLDDWFVVRRSASEANPLIAIMLIVASTFFYLRRSTSTK